MTTREEWIDVLYDWSAIDLAERIVDLEDEIAELKGRVTSLSPDDVEVISHG